MMFFLRKLGYDKDIIEEIKKIAQKLDIKTGWFNAIGALKDLEYGFYDQEKKQYKKFLFKNPCEIVSCTGNISLVNNEIFVHAHIAFSDEQGILRGGHLFKGRIFACEVVILPSIDILKREFDEKTGLKLWK